MSAQGSALVARHGADAAAAPARLARLRAFHTLDALRGVAAIGILLFHVGFLFGLQPAEGYLAVDLFFVMSGFIIAYRYETDFRSGLGLGGFLEVRLIRLYPLFLLGTTLALVPALAAFETGQGTPLYRGVIEAYPFAVLMLPSLTALQHLPEVYPLNYVSWSLAFEILVNIAYAATYRFWTVRRLGVLVAGAALGLGVAATAYGSLNVGFDWSNVAGGLARIVYGFCAGVLIFRLRGRGLPAPRVPWWLLAIMSLCVVFFDPTILGPAWARPAWDVLMVTLVVPAIVVAAIANEPPPRARGACAMAGVFSYVLYSLHAPFTGFFLRGEARLHLDPATTSPARALAFAVLLAVFCIAAHVAYDKPVRRYLSRRLARRRIATPFRGERGDDQGLEAGRDLSSSLAEDGARTADDGSLARWTSAQTARPLLHRRADPALRATSSRAGRRAARARGSTEN